MPATQATTTKTTRAARAGTTRPKKKPATKTVLVSLEPAAFKRKVSQLVDEKPPYRKNRWSELLEVREMPA